MFGHRRSFTVALAAAVGIGAIAPAVASAHAVLTGTRPAAGATLARAPRRVVFEFDQAVGATPGAVRVYAASGARVDDGVLTHPGGQARAIAVGLPARLPDGTYTATYRVISADTHVVFGGLVFNIGHPSRSAQTVAGLIGRERSGPVTIVAAGVVRALAYLSIALVVGILAFLAWATPPLLRIGAFERRLWALLAAGALLGALDGILGILLEGAQAAGTSLWGALLGDVLATVLGDRFGWVWGTRAVALAVTAVLVLAAPGRRWTRPARAWLAALAAYLVATPALAGHAAVQSPVWAFLPSDVLHVLAASVWVGGIVAIVLALPLATRAVAPPQRTAILVEVLGRFSPVALAAVVGLAVTGVVQAYIDVRTVHALTHTPYGELVLLKTGLLGLLIGVGAVNRERIIPSLRRALAAAATPGEAGVLLRRTTRGELAGMVALFAATAALVAFAAPIDAASGPFAADVALGPAELEADVAPSGAGSYQMHLYLIEARSGAPFTGTRQLTVTASLPARGIGPLVERAYPTGPGHFTVPDALLSPAGTWSVVITDRVSPFVEHSVTLHVPVGAP